MKPTGEQTLIDVFELSKTHSIVFFDGVCGLCNGFIDWLNASAAADRYRFAPLQGTTAMAQLSAEDTAGLESIVLISKGQIYRKSDAALQIIGSRGGVWGLLSGLARIIPSPLRNMVYDFIARHRYGWFGKRDTCRIPTPAERKRFLD